MPKKEIVETKELNYEQYLMVKKQTKEYREQYLKAIDILILNENIEEMVLPIINILHQLIENCLKDFILEYYLLGDTVKKSRINFHDLKKLLNCLTDEKAYIHKKFSKIKTLKETVKLLERNIDYFYNNFGEEAFLNSRYPIKSDCIQRTMPDYKINKSEFITNIYKTMINAFTLYEIHEADMFAALAARDIIYDNKEKTEVLNKIVEQYVKPDKIKDATKLIEELIDVYLQRFGKN